MSTLHPINPPVPRRATTQDVCNVLRDWYMPNHDELVAVNAGFAAKVKASGFLGDKTIKSAVSNLDDVTGLIEQDMLDQQAEAMWEAAKQRRTA